MSKLHVIPALILAVVALATSCTGSRTVSESEKPLLLAMRTLGTTSLGYICIGDASQMTCECIEGATSDKWTCEGMKEWCEFFNPNSYKCSGGKCTCQLVLTTSQAEQTTPGSDIGTVTEIETQLSTPPDERESESLSTAPLIMGGSLDYMCSGNGRAKTCICKKGATSERLSCKGMKGVCEVAIGSEMVCDKDGWCRCSRAVGT